MNFADIEKTINLLGEKVIFGDLLPSFTYLSLSVAPVSDACIVGP